MTEKCTITHFHSKFRLRPIDIEAMKRLVKVVNVIPVIAKADSLTLEERDKFKRIVSPSILYTLLFVVIYIRFHRVMEQCFHISFKM